MSDLKSSTAALAVGIAESLLAREISAQDHDRLTSQSIDLIRSQESQ
jgi:F0F1-type ATP synthase membrane subunit b/b'